MCVCYYSNNIHIQFIHIQLKSEQQKKKERNEKKNHHIIIIIIIIIRESLNLNKNYLFFCYFRHLFTIIIMIIVLFLLFEILFSFRSSLSLFPSFLLSLFIHFLLLREEEKTILRISGRHYFFSDHSFSIHINTLCFTFVVVHEELNAQEKRQPKQKHIVLWIEKKINLKHLTDEIEIM